MHPLLKRHWSLASMLAARLITQEHLTGVTMKSAGVQQYGGWFPDIQGMDGRAGRKTRKDCCDSRYGTDWALLVQSGEISSGFI